MVSKLNTQKHNYLQAAVFMLPFQGATKNYDNAMYDNILQNYKQMKHSCRQVGTQKMIICKPRKGEIVYTRVLTRGIKKNVRPVLAGFLPHGKQKS